MQLIARWLHHELRRRINREIERHLVRGAGRRGCQRASPARLNGSVQVATEDALDLQVLRDDGFQVLRIFQADFIHVADKGFERG